MLVLLLSMGCSVKEKPTHQYLPPMEAAWRIQSSHHEEIKVQKLLQLVASSEEEKDALAQPGVAQSYALEGCQGQAAPLCRLPLLSLSTEAVQFMGRKALAVQGPPSPADPSRPLHQLEGVSDPYRPADGLFQLLSQYRQDLAETKELAPSSLATLNLGSGFSPDEPFLLIAVHPRVSYSALLPVLFTAGQAGFSQFFFLVGDAHAPELSVFFATLPSLEPSGFGELVPTLQEIVSITSYGFQLKNGFGLGVEGPYSIPCPAGELCQGTDYAFDDYAGALEEMVSSAQRQHPGFHQGPMVFSPAAEVLWEVIVRTMDASVGTGELSLFPDHQLTGSLLESQPFPPNTPSSEAESLPMVVPGGM